MVGSVPEWDVCKKNVARGTNRRTVPTWTNKSFTRCYMRWGVGLKVDLFSLGVSLTFMKRLGRDRRHRFHPLLALKIHPLPATLDACLSYLRHFYIDVKKLHFAPRVASFLGFICTPTRRSIGFMSDNYKMSDKFARLVGLESSMS